MIFESVPNISEGRDAETLAACAQAVRSSGAAVLHQTSDAVHNRSVLTLAGERDAVGDAALAIAALSLERIDLRAHRGVHPRIGALDVLPFVPLRDATMEAAVELARETAARIWERLRIPCFLYGEAATTPIRRNLAAVRKGEFEGLDARFALPDWRPDVGDIAKHPTAGAIAVGARTILVAFNVELDTGDLAVAKRIAARLRGRDGGLRTLKALGLRLAADRVQVSLNITDYAATPLYRVVELIAAEAAREGVGIARSELIGALPRAAVDDAARYYLGVTPAPRLHGMRG